MHFIPPERLSRWPHFHKQLRPSLRCVLYGNTLPANSSKTQGRENTSLYRDEKTHEVMHVLQRPAQRLMFFTALGWIFGSAKVP